MTRAYKSFLLVTLSLAGFVTSFGAHIVATNLPTYARAVGAGAFTIGLLIAVYDFAELFAKPAAGFVADRRGMKLMLIVGLLVFIGGSLLFLVVKPSLLLLVRFTQGLGAVAVTFTSGPALIATVIIAGIGIGTVWTNSDALIAASAARGKLGARVGAAQSFKEFGDMVGPLLVGAVTQFLGVRIGFVSCGAVALLALMLLSRRPGKGIADRYGSPAEVR